MFEREVFEREAREISIISRVSITSEEYHSHHHSYRKETTESQLEYELNQDENRTPTSKRWREFQSFHNFMFQLRQKNIIRITHSYRKETTESQLEYELTYETRTPDLTTSIYTGTGKCLRLKRSTKA